MEDEHVIGRPPAQQDFLEAELKRRIVAGEFPPGSRLPTRAALIRKYGAGSATLQLALNRLLKDGFICTRGPRGTFVSDRPPHLINYGLILPVDTPEIRSRFWTALEQAGRGLAAAHRSISVYEYNPGDDLQQPTVRRITRDAAGHRVRGLIFAFPPLGMDRLPLLRKPPVPIVGIMPPSETLPSISPDHQAFWKKAVEHLLSRGRRRIAVFGMHEEGGGFRGFAPVARKHCLAIPEHFLQSFDLATAASARNGALLMMRLDPAIRPDGLLISDDNLVEAISAGLAASGVRVPQDLEIVAHANFPAVPAAAVPMHFLGFDCTAILRTCVRIIDVRQTRPPWSRADKELVVAADAGILISPVGQDEVPADSDAEWI